MSGHDDMRSLVGLYAVGELDEDQIPIVEDYLRRHPEERGEVAEIRRILEMASSSSLEEPSPELSAATRERVHMLMTGRAAESEAGRASFGEFVSRFFTKPAYGFSTAFVLVAIGLALYFGLGGVDRPDGESVETPDVSPHGAAGSYPREFGRYMSSSIEVFEQLEERHAAEMMQLLRDRGINDLAKPVGGAMKLLEEEQCEDNPKHKALLTDTEKIWRQLMELKRDPTEEIAERIRRMIAETNVIGRAWELNIPEPDGEGDF